MSAPLTASVRRALWRIPAILAEDGFTTDAALMAELGLGYRELRTAVAILYARRRVDTCNGYLVLPAREPIMPPGRAA